MLGTERNVSGGMAPPRGETIAAPPLRVPPHNLQAEESLLGAMLLSRKAIETARPLVNADDFYKPQWGDTFAAICDIDDAGGTVDPVVVADHLYRTVGRDRNATAAQITSVLAAMANNCAATSNAERYARIVADHAMLRRLIGVAGEIADLAYESPDDVAAAVERAREMVHEATT